MIQIHDSPNTQISCVILLYFLHRSALLLSCERENLWNINFEKLSTARRGRSVYSRTRKELFYIIHLACTLEQLLLSWRHTYLSLFSCVAGCTRASSQGMTGSHGSSLAKMLGADTPLSLARTWSVLRQVRIRQREKWVFWYRCRQFRQPISFEREVTFRGNY